MFFTGRKHARAKKLDAERMNVVLPKRDGERSVRSKPYVQRQIAVVVVVVLAAVGDAMAAATLVEATAVEVTMPVEETLVATTAVVVATDRQHHEGTTNIERSMGGISSYR